MIFTIEQLPYKDLQALGLSRKDIITLPPRTLNALLSGERTSLIRFNEAQLGSTGEKFILDAKISLTPDRNGDPQLRLHPIQQQPVNHFGLTDQELRSIEDGEPFIEKRIKNREGAAMNVLVCKDNMTNEYIAVNKDKIRAPEEINEIKLNDKQKEDFKNGKEIRIGNKNFRLDPSSEIGLSDAGTGGTKDISKIKFNHSSYSNREIMVDLMLLTSGVGAFVLLEHLVDFAANSRIQQKQPNGQLNRQSLTEALSDAAIDIKERAKEHALVPDEIGDIVNSHLAERGIKVNVDKRVVSRLSENNLPPKQAIKRHKLKM